MHDTFHDFCILCQNGILDSIKYNKFYYVFSNSSKLRNYMGIIFLINIILPCSIHILFSIMLDATSNLPSYCIHIQWFIYIIAWIIPTTPYKLLSNFIIVTEISDIVLRVGSSDLSLVITNFIYDFVLIIYLTIQCSLLLYVPYVGTILYFFHSCLLWSFNYYDYKWATSRIDINRRMIFFNNRWPYFLGFGLIPALIDILLPFPYNSGILALILPIMVIVANTCNLNDMKPFTCSYSMFNLPLKLATITINNAIELPTTYKTAINNLYFWKRWK